jgi:hypothetical protein
MSGSFGSSGSIGFERLIHSNPRRSTGSKEEPWREVFHSHRMTLEATLELTVRIKRLLIRSKDLSLTDTVLAHLEQRDQSAREKANSQRTWTALKTTLE